jgi:hypothetical protein
MGRRLEELECTADGDGSNSTGGADLHTIEQLQRQLALQAQMMHQNIAPLRETGTQCVIRPDRQPCDMVTEEAHVDIPPSSAPGPELADLLATAVRSPVASMPRRAPVVQVPDVLPSPSWVHVEEPVRVQAPRPVVEVPPPAEEPPLEVPTSARPTPVASPTARAVTTVSPMAAQVVTVPAIVEVGSDGFVTAAQPPTRRMSSFRWTGYDKADVVRGLVLEWVAVTQQRVCIFWHGAWVHKVLPAGCVPCVKCGG